jgi:hypothetical protein
MSKSPSQGALRFLLKALLLVPVFFVGETCTKLTEVPHDALTPTTAFHTDQEILAGLAGVYAQLRSAEANDHFAALEELSTDMLVVPTRGSDWYDNGQWLDIHKQTWAPNSAGALSFLTNAWNDSFSGVAKANLMIDVVTKAAPANKDTVLAELRTLRAWYYYMLQDQFGGVPLVTTTELQSVERSTRPKIFSFIESELQAAIPNLPLKWDAGNYGRLTKGVANAILASLYINAGVFDKDCGPADCSGKVSANSYNSCSGVTVAGPKDACQAAIDAANAVINSGTYSINPTWAKNFSIDNKSSPENIFVVVHSNSTQQIGGNWPMRTLHYNQLSTGDGGPWNGFATTAEVYNTYPASDERKNMWLAGQQKSFENGQNVNDRQGNPLIFTATIPDVTKADESQGIRFNKFPPQPDVPHGSSQPNDFSFFRLSEMYLIRAEALNEQGSLGAALADLNLIHTKHDPNNPVAAGSKQALRDAIQKERVLEFAAEGKRRTDMIRAGTFLSWTEASLNGVSPTPRAAFRILFPISTNALGSNAKLIQNNGY